MREILFRGKQKDNNEWIEGYYAVQSNHACFAHELKYTHFIFKDIFLDFNLGGLQEFEVIPETVGQYTGLTDKNGKKIFEGDILKYINEDDDPHYITVVFDECAFLIDDQGITDCDLLTSYTSLGLEVVGNVFDNPDLLKAGAET